MHGHESRGSRSRVESGPRRALLGAVVAAAALLVASPAPATAKKPDLVIQSARLADNFVFLDGGPEPVSFKARTKNIGSATAGRSTSVLQYSENRSGRGGALFGGSVAVPRLKPGESDQGKMAGQLDVDLFHANGPQRYYGFLCADDEFVVAESNEENNCHYTGSTLDVIASRFVGDVKGNSPMGYGPNVKESWEGTLSFDYAPTLSRPGYYVYQPTGELTYTVTGTYSDPAGSCSYSGTGTHDVAGTGSLALEYEGGTYSGTGQNFAPFFSYTQDCVIGTQHFTGTFQEGTEAAWWQTGQGDLFFDISPFKLVDSFDLTVGQQTVHWQWNLGPGA